MTRKARELAQRHRAQVTILPIRSWAPEIAGICLLAAAILCSAGVFAA